MPAWSISVDASEDGTVISRTVTGKPARIIRSLWTDAWQREGIEPLPMPYQGIVAGPVMAAANQQGRGDINRVPRDRASA